MKTFKSLIKPVLRFFKLAEKSSFVNIASEVKLIEMSAEKFDITKKDLKKIFFTQIFGSRPSW